ncbi:MAG: glycosyltransferase family 4 protein [Lentisphaerae bacterium]|nr:glycosyltransferase family 4 protein [Lentisphaerota bacterium]
MNLPLRLGVNTLFYLPGEVGGSETYLLETLRALARIPDAPDLVLFTNAENHARLRAECPGAERVATGVGASSRPARILAEQIRLPRRVRRARVDVLWSPGYTAPLFCACPQVVSLLDMQYKRFPRDVSWLAARTMDLLYPAAARRCEAVVAISEFTKADVVRFTGIPADKVTVTPLAADPSFGVPAGPPPAEVRGTPYLLCVANTYPHKNVDGLVRAFNRIAGDIPHRLVLVGKPRLGEPAAAAALAETPPGRAVRLSDLRRRDLIALYQGADGFVFPSLYEGFGLPVLEAMTAGTPVLTTREASIPEVGGDAVRYADSRDEAAFAAALREFAELPPSERERQAVAAKERARGFTWEAGVQALWSVLVRVKSRQ